MKTPPDQLSVVLPATETWRRLLSYILDNGAPASPRSAGAAWKDNDTLEILALQSVWPMKQPVILCPVRKLGYRFMAAEAAWVLSGDNRVSTIAPYGRAVERFSDDGLHFEGAYGPPFLDQVSHVVRALARDRDTRQAVASIWRPRVTDSKDPPCTLSLQWLIREGELNCVATMRSSDAWTGVPYDVFTFSMMSAYVSLALHHFAVNRDHFTCPGTSELARPRPIPLGELILTTGSGHLYAKEQGGAEQCRREIAQLTHEPALLNLDEFSGPYDLMSHLWQLATIAPAQVVPHKWLREVFT